MSCADAAEKLAAIADRLAELKPYRHGDRFFVERHNIERQVRALAEEVARIDPDRRRRAFRPGMIAVKSRIIPVSVRAGRLPRGRF